MGMVAVACRAAIVAAAGTETITSTFTETSSCANAGRRSNWPSAMTLLNLYRLPLDIASLRQASHYTRPYRVTSRSSVYEKQANAGELSLLRACRRGPPRRGCRAQARPPVASFRSPSSLLGLGGGDGLISDKREIRRQNRATCDAVKIGIARNHQSPNHLSRTSALRPIRLSMKGAASGLYGRDAGPVPVHEHLHAGRRNPEVRGSAVRIVAARRTPPVQEVRIHVMGSDRARPNHQDSERARE